jgi:microcystin-dependent protein
MKKSMIRNVLTAGLVFASLPAAACSFEPYLGTICTMGTNFCPRGWAPAEGGILPIAQNQALFSLLGTQFGGDGQVTFALPDLRGRSVLGVGTGPGLSQTAIGEKGGAESSSLTIASQPVNNQISKRTVTVDVVTQVGGSPINTRSPYLGMTTCIAIEGVYPSRP